MGLLSEGNPLSWDETKKLADHVREHGVIQFINLYHRLKNKTGDILKFGDEVCINVTRILCIVSCRTNVVFIILIIEIRAHEIPFFIRSNM